MRKTAPTKIPNFKNDKEIAAFMERHSAFDLIDAGLAEIVPTAFAVFGVKRKKPLLKNRRVRVAFKDEESLRKNFSALISSTRTFIVLDADASGILLMLSDSPTLENVYIPYSNIGGIKLLEELKNSKAGKSARAV